MTSAPGFGQTHQYGEFPDDPYLSDVAAGMNVEFEPELAEHRAETVAPGELLVIPEEHILLVDCACGAELRVSKEPDEGAAIDAAMAQHRIHASRASDPGYVELPAPDWRTDVTDEGDAPDDGDGGNPPAAGSGERVR